MTNEEAIEILKQRKVCMECVVEPSDCYKCIAAFNLAIKALETGEVYMTGEDYNLYMEGYKAGKKDFEPKQGEWIDTGDMEEYWSEEYQCSVCGAKDHWHNFCPNCGADMRGENNG